MLADCNRLGEVMGDPGPAAELGRVVRLESSPELVNDGIDTAPSKRIKKAYPQYEKTLHGPLVIADAGIDTIRSTCPHADDWLRRLETRMSRPVTERQGNTAGLNKCPPTSTSRATTPLRTEPTRRRKRRCRRTTATPTPAITPRPRCLDGRRRCGRFGGGISRAASAKTRFFSPAQSPSVNSPQFPAAVSDIVRRTSATAEPRCGVNRVLGRRSLAGSIAPSASRPYSPVP